MKKIVWLLACMSLWLIQTAQAAPLIEYQGEAISLPLASYIDVLEDPEKSLSIEDVVSERHTYRFASAPLTELFFGYTSSVYWIRFSLDNQQDQQANLVLNIAPTDLDYLDLYQIDTANRHILSHRQSGSAVPYEQREYRHPLYFFDVNVPARSNHTFFLRVESNKTINLQLRLDTHQTSLAKTSQDDWRHGFLLGGLFILALLHAGLFVLFRFKGLLWGSLFIFSVMLVQTAWDGNLLQLFQPNDLLLDRQIIVPVYIALLFASLYAQSILNTRSRAPWQHTLLNLFIVASLLGVVQTWVIPPATNAMFLVGLAMLNAVAIFAFALHANMEGLLLARYFLFARTFTTSIILIAIFNIHGYMPQGAFTNWGVAAAVLFESVIMLVILCLHCLHELRKSQQSPALTPRARPGRTLINLSDICHELRTPVSGILGMADLLLEANLTEQQQNQVKTVRKSGQALLDVTNRISDLSQIESGTVELTVAPFELTAMIEKCVENCRSRAESSNLELIYHVDAALPAYVSGDAGKLQQVTINMLNFALRHLEKGEVILNVFPGDQDEIAFNIRSGSNTLIDRTLSTERYNLGASDNLNITIAEQYLLLMNATLVLHTHIGEGVTISYRVSLNEATAPASLTDRSNDLEGKRMLIVDDNATCCTIIEQQAIQWGMSVTSAYGGKEALAILRSSTTLTEPYDIVLTDYEMPVMNGLELAHNIRDDHKISSEKLLIVMLTGLSHSPTKENEHNQDIQAVLYKPISGKSLKQALQTALLKHLEDPHIR